MLSKLKPIWSLLLLILCVAVQQSTPAEFIKVPDLPIGMPRCTKDDRDINECLKSAFQQMAKFVRNGVPELNIPSVDPWAIDLNGYQYSSPNMQIDIRVSNVLVYGTTEIVFDKVDFRLLKDGGVRMELISHIPHIFAEGLYNTEFVMNELKFQPHGYFNISVDNFQVTRHPTGQLRKRNGHIYLRLKCFDAIPKVDDIKFFMSDLLPDPTMNEVLLDIINTYWGQLHKSLLPEIRQIWEPLVIDNANDYFSAFPFDLILEPNKLI